MSTIAERLQQVEQNIADACKRSSRKRKDVKLIIVTKTAQAEQICEVLKLGYCDFGENRLTHLKQVSQEVSKFLIEQHQIDEDQTFKLPKRVNWHMIGHLQRNKVRQTLPLVSSIHSVDTLRLAEELNNTAVKLQMKPKIYLQVNCSGEVQKYGTPVGAAVHLAEQICTMPNLQLIGMMTMAPLTDNENLIRASFKRAKEIFDDISKEPYISNSFTNLSMGMSNDYQIAVEEGATHLRIGSDIFSENN